MSAGGDNGGDVTQYNVTQYNAIPADMALTAAQPSPGQPSPAQDNTTTPVNIVHTLNMLPRLGREVCFLSSS